METNLLQYVIQEINKRKGKWRQLCEEMSDEPDRYYTWMTKVAYGKTKNPGVKEIQRLANYFSQQNKKAA